MKKLILLVVLYELFNNNSIALGKSNPETHMSEDINAILIKCPKNHANSSCEPHLIINIHMNPSVDVKNMKDSWILDEVYDPTKRRVLKIISPYLIVISRGEPVVMYPLQYEKSIKKEELKGKLPTENDAKEVKGAPSSKTNEPSPSTDTKEHQDVKDDKGSASGKTSEPLNPINMKEREEVKDAQGSPAPKTDEPRPRINMKESEEVKDVPGSPAPKTDEPRPHINMKEGEDVKDVPGFPSGKTNEHHPFIKEHEEVKDVQGSPSSKTNEPRPHINMKESEDIKDVPGSPSGKANEHRPFIKEREEVKDVQGSPSRKNDEPHPKINLEENYGVEDLQSSPSHKTYEPSPFLKMEEPDKVEDLQGSPSHKSNEPSPFMKMEEPDKVEDLKGSSYSKTYEPSPSMKMEEPDFLPRPKINMQENKEVGDLQGSSSRKNDEPSRSSSMEEQEEFKGLQGYLSRKYDEPSPSINLEKQDEVKDLPSSPSGNSNEPLTPISSEEHQDVNDLQGSSSRMTNEPLTPVNAKETEEVPKELLGSPSGNTNEPSINMKENECNNSSRLKRNHGRVSYTSHKSLESNNAFLPKMPTKDTTWNQNDISSLGLVQVIDPSLKKFADQLEGQKAHQRLNFPRTSKYSSHNEKLKNVLGSYQYYNQEPYMKVRNKVDKIASDLKEYNYNQEPFVKGRSKVDKIASDLKEYNWDKQIPDRPTDNNDILLQDWKKNSNQKHNEGRDYQLKSEGHPDNDHNDKKKNVLGYYKYYGQEPYVKDRNKVNQIAIDLPEYYTGTWDKQILDTPVDNNDIPLQDWKKNFNQKHNEGRDYQLKSEDKILDTPLDNNDILLQDWKKHNEGRDYQLKSERYPKYNHNDKQKNVLGYYKYYNQEPYMKDRNKIAIDLPEYYTGTWDKQILDMPLDNNDILLQDWKKDFNQKHNEGRDYQLKSEWHPDGQRKPDLQSFDRMDYGDKRKYNTEEMKIYRPNNKSPDNIFSYNKINKYNREEMENYKPKNISPENIFSYNTINENKNINLIKNDLVQRSKMFRFLPNRKKEQYNLKSRDNSLSNVKDFSHERTRVQSNFKQPLNSRNNFNDIPRVRQKDRYDYRQPPDLPSDLNERKNDYYNAKTDENSIYKEKYLPQGREPEDFNVKSDPTNVPSRKESKEFNSNAPMKGFSGMNDIPYPLEYDQFNFNPSASSFPNINDHTMGQKNNKDDNHMRENLQNNYVNKNDENIDWAYSHSQSNNFNPDDLSADPGLSYSYSEFPQRSQKEPFSNYARNNPVTSLQSRDHTRTKRSNSPKNQDAPRFVQKAENDLNAQKLDENGEVPCDTCGGKNKKKDEKPPSRYCSALADPKSPESKMDDFNVQGKLNDVVPCDTCGGKNKKPGGKYPPESLESDIHKGKISKYVLPLTAEDMIPCERCKGHLQGTLAASQSCGCVNNPSVCGCEDSQSSRLAKKSEEDLSFSVFNMNTPVPFLTTQLRVFRRRHNTWWRVVPIVTLDSLSGIFANKNMSMVFTSHVGTFRQEKSSSFSNHKLLVPKSCATQLTKSMGGLSALKDLQNNIGRSFLVDKLSRDVSSREVKNSKEEDIKRIGTLGHFPESMGTLQKCPHKDKHLCLNIRGERVPAFSIKVKIPFRENAFLIANKHVVKIAQIVTDATTKDALQISIDVINKGLEAQEFSIFIYNCPLSNSVLSTTSVRRVLLPNVGQNVIFLLPFISGSKKNRKFSCEVVVKDYDPKNVNTTQFTKSPKLKDGVIARRSMEIKVLSRCFCVWRCRCHCMEKLETFINYNVCERISRKSQEEAGLIYNCPPGNEINDICITDANDDRKESSCNLVCKIRRLIIFILILLLTLGVLKAFLGLCIRSIDQWGFETVQPGRYYACTSRIRVFIVNLFFFFIYPFACWCKCFQPKPEDLMAASTDWSCNHEREEEGSTFTEQKRSGKKVRLQGGQTHRTEDLLHGFPPYYENALFKDDKPDDEESTTFILEVLEESKASLSKMMNQTAHSAHSEEIVPKCAANSEEERAAEELVDSLKGFQRAFRTMSSPLGGVIEIPENCQYCVKGFFQPRTTGTYAFFSYHPLIQYIGISEENEVKKLPEPQYLHTDEFYREYNNKIDVLEAGDLSVDCPPNVPCINTSSVENLEHSFLKLTALMKDIPKDEMDSES